MKKWISVALAAWAAVVVSAVVSAGRAPADPQDVRIREVMVGANGASNVQFIVVEQAASGQHLWGPQGAEAQSRAMLAFYDATGRETGIYKFPASPAPGGSLKVLIATAEFAALLGAPVPDVIIPALAQAMSGQICFVSNPANANAATQRDCVSYGSFTGATGDNIRGGIQIAAGAPAATLPVTNTVSLRRTGDTGTNSDFALTASPTPTNVAGATMTMLVDSQVLQGSRLFNQETFGGNGRTCATCHVPATSFMQQPGELQTRFANVATTYDPLFVAETMNSGAPSPFDYNLNVLTLTEAVPTGAPCTGELRGIITSPSTDGRGKVIAKTSATTYLVGGGISPMLAGAVTDGTCSGTVSSIVAGTLGAVQGSATPGLEFPTLMRTSRADATLFPFGRALFLENIDQAILDNTSLAVHPRVFRKSPHLLNMSFTADFGFSGDVTDLLKFSTGAVQQHYPRTLVRSSGGASPDFRLPTPAELQALEAFQLAQQFPSGSDPAKFDLSRFATSAAAIRGMNAFFGPVAKCSRCHGGPVLATMTEDIVVDTTDTQLKDTNGKFNTGVVNQTFSGGTGADNLPCEQPPGGGCGSRRFSVPQLFNVKHLTPLFHDASSADVQTAVVFYNSPAFNNSPAGQAIGGIRMPAPANGCVGPGCTMVQDITAFLESLVMPSIAANSATAMNGLDGSAVGTPPSVVVRDDMGVPKSGTPVTFAVSGANGSIGGATATTNASGVATLGSWTLGPGVNTVTANLEGATGSPVTFSAWGASIAASISSSPSSTSVAAGGTATFSAAAAGSAPPSIRWHESADGSTWTSLTDTPPYSGTATATLTLSSVPVALHGRRYRAVATNSTGTATSSAATLTVRGPATTAPTALRFTATKSGSTLTASTPPQQVTVTFTGASSAWSASSNVSWLQLSSASANGAGVFSATLANPGDVIGTATSLIGQITLSTPNAPIATSTLTVTLSITSAAGTGPLGQVDTPVQNAAGVQGAIAVTGWAVDNLGVSSVKIYRTCLSFDVPASCQAVLGHNVVFVGDAAFLPGARGDVEAAFSTYPQANRAGWGYLLLTSMLPHIPTSQPYGGQGALSLVVVATDVEGNQKVLGRSSDPAGADYATPTAITLANDSIQKPFGAIDTPSQGQTVSGVLNNFGWALTPDANTTAESGDVLIPTNGSTVTVFIDGLPVSLVAYNQCRGSVGNPVPATLFCDDDVANIFGNATPQPVFSVRTQNATRFRNLDAARGAIGSFTIDTTTLTNGLHTIAWSVTDSASRTEGIGSRFFTVVNSGSSDGEAAARAARRPQTLAELGPALDREILGRAGYDGQMAAERLEPNGEGVLTAAFTELGRLELSVGPGVGDGYLLAGDELRPLPLGSSLRDGLFAWTPPAGYLGTYRLVFAGSGGYLAVDVVIRPGTAASPALRASIDSPSAGVSMRGVFTVGGWALDPASLTGAGIKAVHVWAIPTITAGGRPVFLGAAAVGGHRPDVAADHGAGFARSGWSLTAEGLASGSYTLTAFFWSSRTNRWEDARSVSVQVR